MALHLAPGTRLVAATHNAGKARELAALLDARFDVVSAASLGLTEPDEPETTFIGNAVIKARAAAAACGLVAIADDSGLCVGGLDGAPGVHSARWSGPTRNFDEAMDRVARPRAATWQNCSAAPPHSKKNLLSSSSQPAAEKRET